MSWQCHYSNRTYPRRTPDTDTYDEKDGRRAVYAFPLCGRVDTLLVATAVECLQWVHTMSYNVIQLAEIQTQSS